MKSEKVRQIMAVLKTLNTDEILEFRSLMGAAVSQQPPRPEIFVPKELPRVHYRKQVL